jgi:hypothetical protein
MTSTSPNPHPLVEEFARRKFRLESILEAQSVELRKDPEKYFVAHERNQHGFAHPGDRWMPQDATEKENNVRLMEEMCYNSNLNRRVSYA